MPTTLDRTPITHTPPVKSMLRTAARHWPEDRDNPRVLMLHLMEVGNRTLNEQELANAYEDAFADWQGSEDAAFWDSFSADGLGE